MKITLAVLFLALSTIANAQFAGDYSGYYEPLKCKRGVWAYEGEFNFTVDSYRRLQGELEYDPANRSWIYITGRVARSGRIVFGKELRREKISVSMKITKQGALIGKWRSRYCRGTLAGWNHF